MLMVNTSGTSAPSPPTSLSFCQPYTLFLTTSPDAVFPCFVSFSKHTPLESFNVLHIAESKCYQINTFSKTYILC